MLVPWLTTGTHCWANWFCTGASVKIDTLLHVISWELSLGQCFPKQSTLIRQTLQTWMLLDMLLRNVSAYPFITLPLWGKLFQHWFWMLYMNRMYTTYVALFLRVFQYLPPIYKGRSLLWPSPYGAKLERKDPARGTLEFRIHLDSFQFAWR